MLGQKRVALFISVSNESSSGYEIVKDVQYWSGIDYALFLFGAISNFYCQLNLYVPDYYLYLAVSVMWSGAISFSRYIISSECDCWKNLSKRYKVMHCLAEHVNQSLCFAPLWWFVAAAFYFTFNLNELILDFSAPETIKIHECILSLNGLLLDVLFAYCCVEICSKVN